MIRGDALSRVPERNRHKLMSSVIAELFTGADGQGPSINHGINRVCDNVPENLLYLSLINCYAG